MTTKEQIARWLFNREYKKVFSNLPQDDAWANCSEIHRKWWYQEAEELLALLSPPATEGQKWINEGNADCQCPNCVHVATELTSPVSGEGIKLPHHFTPECRQCQDTVNWKLASALKANRVATAAEIIPVYEAYIKLLGEELNELVPLAHNHGWKSSRFEAGVKCRADIDAVKAAYEDKV